MVERFIKRLFKGKEPEKPVDRNLRIRYGLEHIKSGETPSPNEKRVIELLLSDKSRISSRHFFEALHLLNMDRAFETYLKYSNEDFKNPNSKAVKELKSRVAVDLIKLTYKLLENPEYAHSGFELAKKVVPMTQLNEIEKLCFLANCYTLSRTTELKDLLELQVSSYIYLLFKNRRILKLERDYINSVYSEIQNPSKGLQNAMSRLTEAYSTGKLEGTKIEVIKK